MPGTKCRITSLDVTGTEMITALCGGNAGSLRVLLEWVQVEGVTAFMGFLNSVDAKHLYDGKIWDVYNLCGQDIHRFTYHVEMELPDQDTGQLSVTGPYCSKVGDEDEFLARRTFGTPGSFWALENPPTRTDYEYPIV